MEGIIGFDTTVFPRLNYKEPNEFWEKIEEIKAFFRENRGELESCFVLAKKVEHAFSVLDPFIESYTSRICPYCGTVCCANKFGFPEFADVVVFFALGLEVPRYDLSVNEEDICQFIGERGCVLPRPQRPYRCTWYFCDPIIIQLDLGPAKTYRKFIHELQSLSGARGELLRNFYSVWSKKR